MIEREHESAFIAWLRSEISNLVIPGAPQDPANPRLTSMREAGGVDYLEAEAQSVAFQVEFDHIHEARKWNRETFADLAAKFEEKFGPQAMVFTSIFEHIPLN